MLHLTFDSNAACFLCYANNHVSSPRAFHAPSREISCFFFLVLFPVFVALFAARCPPLPHRQSVRLRCSLLLLTLAVAAGLCFCALSDCLTKSSGHWEHSDQRSLQSERRQQRACWRTAMILTQPTRCNDSWCGSSCAAAADCTYPATIQHHSPLDLYTLDWVTCWIRSLTHTARLTLPITQIPTHTTTAQRMHSTTLIATFARCTRSTTITLTRDCTRGFARRAARHTQHTAMSVPASSASITATGMPTWVKPLLRLPLPPSCTLQRRRGEAIWETQPDDDEQAAQLHQSMQGQKRNVELSGTGVERGAASTS